MLINLVTTSFTSTVIEISADVFTNSQKTRIKWHDRLGGRYPKGGGGLGGIGAEMGYSHTRTFLNNLKSVTVAILDPATPITLEDYVTKVNHLIESTSSCPSIVTPAMVKKEALDTELIKIGCIRFNFP